jgi:dsRNA-specific ribonuclease
MKKDNNNTNNHNNNNNNTNNHNHNNNHNNNNKTNNYHDNDDVNKNDIISDDVNNLLYKTNISKQIINLDELGIESEGCVNPFNKNNKPITENWVQNILKKYGIYQNINDISHYQRAFVHQSYTESYVKDICIRDNVSIVPNPDGCMLLQPKSYERYEWLGDCLIDTFVGTYIFNRFPTANEGFMSSLKKSLISRWVLGQLAQKCNFHEYMVISKTLDDKCNARDDIKKCCDIFEAFIASIYLDFNKDKHGVMSPFMSGLGFQIAEKFFINILEDPETLIDITSYILDDKNYIVQLRNYCCRVLGCKNAVYTCNEYKASNKSQHNKILQNLDIQPDLETNNTDLETNNTDLETNNLDLETNNLDLETNNNKKWIVKAKINYNYLGEKKQKVVFDINDMRNKAKQNCARKLLEYFNLIEVS